MPYPGNLSDPGIEAGSPALQEYSLLAELPTREDLGIYHTKY